MAVIKKDDKEIKVANGEPIIEACEKLGVPFSCKEGYCGTCKITIEEGSENLSELTNEEKMMERDRNNRLACQVKIKQGIVEIGGN